jgi:hypothetical protein
MARRRLRSADNADGTYEKMIAAARTRISTV